jgi:hypothetical protein
MNLTANWRQEIHERWDIKGLENADDLTDPVLWATRCSKTKNGIHSGTPKELYVSSVNRYFYRCMEEQGLRYGVLSDKYGFHFDNEKLPNYDIHPSDLSQRDRKLLGQLIRDKAVGQGFARIVFYSPSPLMSVPYFEMLHHSGLEVFYTTRLNFSRGPM